MRSKRTWVGALLALSTLATILAPFATPSASALEGAVKGGPVTLEGGGATLECTSSEGKYVVVKPKGEKWEEQEPSNPGKDLVMDIEKWNGCKAKTSSQKELKPTISACTLHLQDEAPAGEKTPESKAAVSVVSACTVKTTVLFFSCTITLLAGKSSEKINAELPVAELKNAEPEKLLINMGVSGLTTTASGSGCSVGGVEGSKGNKLKGEFDAGGVIHL